jgi:hypothetical protein
VVFSPLIGVAQPVQFTRDSIPTANGKVEFNVNFKFNLDKNQFHKKAYAYLNDVLNPSVGTFRADNEDSTVCRITDYLSIDNGVFQKFGMYMTYNIRLVYRKGTCSLIIHNIEYMEKGSYEAIKDHQRDMKVMKWSGSDVLIERKYHLMFIRKASERITDATLNRINSIIKALYASFENKAS